MTIEAENPHILPSATWTTKKVIMVIQSEPKGVTSSPRTNA
jgi:hypothetical protein